MRMTIAARRDISPFFAVFWTPPPLCPLEKKRVTPLNSLDERDFCANLEVPLLPGKGGAGCVAHLNVEAPGINEPKVGS